MEDKGPKTMPEHPGEVLLRDFMKPQKITTAMLSQAINLPVKTLDELILKKSTVTPDIAIRFSRYWGNSAQFWLNLQAEYDIAQTLAEKSNCYDAIKPRLSPSSCTTPSKKNCKLPQHIRNMEELRTFFKSGGDKDIVLSKTFFDHLLEHPYDRNAQEWILDEQTKNRYLRFMLNFAYEEDPNAALLYNILQKRSCTVPIETPIFQTISHETALYAYAVRKFCSCLFQSIFNTPSRKYNYFPMLYGLRSVQERYVMIWGHQISFEESRQDNEIKVLLDNIRGMLEIPAQCKMAGRTPIDEKLIQEAFHEVFAPISGGPLSRNPLAYQKKKDLPGVQMEEEIIKHMLCLWKALTQGILWNGKLLPRRKNEKYFKPLSSDNCDQVREILLKELAGCIEDTLAIFLQYFDVDKASPDIAYEGIKQCQTMDGWAVGFEIAAGASTLKICPSISVEKLKKLHEGYSIPEICKAAVKVRKQNQFYKKKIHEENFKRYLYDCFKNVEPLPSSRSTTGKGQGNAHKYPLETFETPINSYNGGAFCNLYAEIIELLE